jgi:hypothetical protein
MPTGPTSLVADPLRVQPSRGRGLVSHGNRRHVIGWVPGAVHGGELGTLMTPMRAAQSSTPAAESGTRDLQAAEGAVPPSQIGYVGA